MLCLSPRQRGFSTDGIIKMNMNQVLAAATVLLVVAACSREPEQPARPVAGGDAQGQVPAGERLGKKKLHQPLPEQIVLDFRHQLRSDSVVEEEGRKRRRKVAMEYLEGDQTSTFASIERSLQAAGFDLRDRKQMENGNLRAKFDKPGYGTIIVTITDDMNVTAQNPAALGRAFLDMPVER